MRRRDLVIGGVCAGAAGAAYLLKPKTRVSRLGTAKLEDVTPWVFQGWSGQSASDLVAASPPGSLAARLYGTIVERVYRRGDDDADAIMMMLAYGGSQTNDLQVHRPEACYPAFGFELSQNQPLRIQILRGLSLPARRLVAEIPGRTESIVYWTRLGDYLPETNDEQRVDRLRTSLQGIVPDGLLARFSVTGSDLSRSFSNLTQFIPAFLQAVDPPHRAAFVGATLAGAMAAR